MDTWWRRKLRPPHTDDVMFPWHAICDSSQLRTFVYSSVSHQFMRISDRFLILFWVTFFCRCGGVVHLWRTSHGVQSSSGQKLTGKHSTGIHQQKQSVINSRANRTPRIRRNLPALHVPFCVDVFRWSWGPRECGINFWGKIYAVCLPTDLHVPSWRTNLWRSTYLGNFLLFLAGSSNSTRSATLITHSEQNRGLGVGNGLVISWTNEDGTLDGFKQLAMLRTPLPKLSI